MKKYLILFSISALISKALLSQVAINGPVCVKAGTEYQYTIDSKWPENAKAKISITGGVFSESGQTSIAADIIASVKVIWNQKATSGKISFSSSVGTATIDVTVAADLFPGSLAVSKSQEIAFNSKASIINCTAASGGNCSPSFTYQWQSSDNALVWNDIAGATTQNLSISSLLKNQVFYRRKVTEIVSGVISYSETATVFIQPEVRN